MAVLMFLATQLVIVAAVPVKPFPPNVIAAQLRGPPVSPLGAAPSPSVPSAPSAPAFVDERGERGHFLYADACEDCFYKGAQCGCSPAMEYFACLTKHCHSANGTKFKEKCGNLKNRCKADLEIHCYGPDSVCTGKHNQLPTGGIGFTLDLDSLGNDAFCGPHGKCIGTLHMKVNIHNAQQQPPELPVPATASGAPAPVAAAAPFPAPPASASLAWLECGLPKVPNASIDNQAQWNLCRAQVTGDKAGCDLPVFSTLQASEDKEAYCVLTEGGEGNPPKRLTAPAWFVVSNSHDGKLGYRAHHDPNHPLPWMRNGQCPQGIGHVIVWAVVMLLTHTVKEMR